MATRRYNVNAIHLQGKSLENPCEDVVAANPYGWSGVVDGATQTKDGTYYTLSGEAVAPGLLAAETVANTLEQASPNLSPRELVDLLSLNVDAVISSQPVPHVLEQSPPPSCVFAATNGNLVVSVGDCHIGVEDSDGSVTLFKNHFPLDKVLAERRASVIDDLLRSSDVFPVGDPGWDAILEDLQNQYVFANDPDHPYGYPVINGAIVPDVFINVMELSQSTRKIVLATDGYPTIAPDGILDYWDAEKYLRAAILEDPYCVKDLLGVKMVFPENVSYDDRAWLSIILPDNVGALSSLEAIKDLEATA